jgi:AraC-like DNA-binding protein
MLIIRLLFYIAAFFPFFQRMRYMGDWWQFFSFAIIFYYIAIEGFSNSIETKVPFKFKLLGYHSPKLLQYTGTDHNDSFIEDAEVIDIDNEPVSKTEDDNLLNEWKLKIVQLLEKDKIYEDPELSLTQMAKQLGTNPSLLSKMINQGFQQNFNDFINNYRIEAVKQKLQLGEQKTQTLLGIAYDCGFNSKATFNRAFKKVTGVSPKEWLQKKAA